ncbi:MAG: hypothetical protein DWH79_07585 [Planctomycetota bacterium]|nr:MAG: hypothetical protein DWH79_07585 [Planctomycetota bacterium]
MTRFAIRKHDPSSRRALLLGTALVLLTGGCSASGRVAARRLLDDMSTGNRKLATTITRFNEVLLERVNDKCNDEAVLNSLEGVRALIRELDEASQGWKIPETVEAVAVVKAYRDHLAGRDSLFAEKVPLILESLAVPELTKAERSKRTKGVFDQIRVAEKKSLKALRDEQRKFAASAGIFAYD